MQEEIKNYNVNGEMVWTGELSKVKGVVQEKPLHYHIRPLNIRDAEAMSSFSHKIYENLRSGEECFIHKHDAVYYHQIFQNPQVKYIGTFIGNQLIAMSYLTICENKAELEAELPNSNYNFFAKDRKKNNIRIASFGADSVLPEYRGNGLNMIMIAYRLTEAQKLGCTDCTSIVDRNNRWNMAPYFSSRFNLYATAIDPSDGGKISLLHKPMEKDTILSNIKTRVSLPYNRLDLIDSLLDKGFVGIEFNREDASVTFAHSSYYKPTQHTIILPYIQTIKAYAAI